MVSLNCDYMGNEVTIVSNGTYIFPVGPLMGLGKLLDLHLMGERPYFDSERTLLTDTSYYLRNLSNYMIFAYGTKA